MQHTVPFDARINLATLPPVQGRDMGWYDARHRVYTVEHLPFDALAARPDGGPVTVPCADWTVCTSGYGQWWIAGSSGEGAFRLNVFRFDEGAVMVRHPLDGTEYATTHDLKRAAYDAGLLGFKVDDYDAPKYGLPRVADAQAAERG